MGKIMPYCQYRNYQALFIGTENFMPYWLFTVDKRGISLEWKIRYHGHWPLQLLPPRLKRYCHLALVADFGSVAFRLVRKPSVHIDRYEMESAINTSLFAIKGLFRPKW